MVRGGLTPRRALVDAVALNDGGFTKLDFDPRSE